MKFKEFFKLLSAAADACPFRFVASPITLQTKRGRCESHVIAHEAQTKSLWSAVQVVAFHVKGQPWLPDDRASHVLGLSPSRSRKLKAAGDEFGKYDKALRERLLSAVGLKEMKRKKRRQRL